MANLQVTDHVIYKYPIHLSQGMVQELIVNKGFEVLDVQVQGHTITLWGKTDLKAPSQTFTIAIVGTGQHVLGIHDEYLATVQLDGFVWHIFKCAVPERQIDG